MLLWVQKVYNPPMLVLGIETSCDETGVALYDSQAGLVAHLLHSQVALHARYGGVVPELASRDHVRKLPGLIKQLLAESGVGMAALDAIGYTAGPGLVGALLVGVCSAHAMAAVLKIPVVEVHHMEGHLLAPMLEPSPPAFPFVALLVSGGHTMLVWVTGLGRYEVLGETLDDAVGEAFDKTAKLLGLGYPGGPAVAAAARDGVAGRFGFPRPMTRKPGLDFSFSGLKTFTRVTYEKHAAEPNIVADIAAEFEQSAVDTLVIKCRRAMQQTGSGSLVVAGGVGANQRLRARLADEGRQSAWQVFFPRPEFCTDNGAMIAYTAWLKLQSVVGEAPVQARPRWPL